jgi:GntR family transcriptional regulator
VQWAERRKPTASARAAFDLTKGDLVHAINRLRFADDDPIALETTYFPEKLTPGLLEEPLEGSLWDLLQSRYGIVASRASTNFDTVVLDHASCAKLRVRSASPGMLLTRRTFAQGGRCFEFARDEYRADRVTFEVESVLDHTIPDADGS